MDHPKTYLLKKIAGYEKNGLSTLGHLNAVHLEDLAVVINEFAKECVLEVVEHINNGYAVDLDGLIIGLKNGNKVK